VAGAITLAYQKVNLKLTHDIGETNIINTRSNIATV
jgi:hypothetical protein